MKHANRQGNSIERLLYGAAIGVVTLCVVIAGYYLLYLSWQNSPIALRRDITALQQQVKQLQDHCGQ